MNTHTAKRDSGLPEGGAGRRDVVEPIPDNVRRVDPNIVEGQPGYDESGNSEIMRPERFASGTPGQPRERPSKS
jgi:hypothetical protein